MAAVVAQRVAEERPFSVEERTQVANGRGRGYPLSATNLLICQMARLVLDASLKWAQQIAFIYVKFS